MTQRFSFLLWPYQPLPIDWEGNVWRRLVTSQVSFCTPATGPAPKIGSRATFCGLVFTLSKWDCGDYKQDCVGVIEVTHFRTEVGFTRLAILAPKYSTYNSEQEAI